MSCKAILTKVNDKPRVRTKLPQWTDENPDEIIKDVEAGNERVITTLDCDACKADLEKNNAAVVRVESGESKFQALLRRFIPTRV